MTPSVILSDGRMYVPAASLLRSLSLSHTVSGANVTITGNPAPVLSADRYYAEDAVYWLSRIISAESRGESLLGQIAVGTVVLNRVKSPSFPNTIWSVIFDKKYGVQFSPVSNGTIYQEPTQSSILAAKICLEGFRVEGEPLYFLRPSASTSSWIVNNRKYIYTIGNHYFFQ
ncbi:MAG: cell wall hydrolase [Clostridia bacterium]|nr:cell wall hydrolase [Clostridia bacterium]